MYIVQNNALKAHSFYSWSIVINVWMLALFTTILMVIYVGNALKHVLNAVVLPITNVQAVNRITVYTKIHAQYHVQVVIKVKMVFVCRIAYKVAAKFAMLRIPINVNNAQKAIFNTMINVLLFVQMELIKTHKLVKHAMQNVIHVQERPNLTAQVVHLVNFYMKADAMQIVLVALHPQKDNAQKDAYHLVLIVLLALRRSVSVVWMNFHFYSIATVMPSAQMEGMEKKGFAFHAILLVEHVLDLTQLNA